MYDAIPHEKQLKNWRRDAKNLIEQVTPKWLDHSKGW